MPTASLVPRFSDQDVLFEVHRRLQPSDERLAATVGLAFRLSTMNLIFTADVMARAGYFFPPGQPFRSNTLLGDYLAVATRLSFMDYFNGLYAKRHASQAVSLQELIDQSSLEFIESWLSGQPGIGLLTDADDVILADGDLEGLRGIFGVRSRIYPTGGHMRNLAHRAVADYIARYLETVFKCLSCGSCEGSVRGRGGNSLRF